ncbi:MAG: response regulator transcription factor [Solirubrobacterales bacterium]|nr:response regulator transcription factor [Solirubrobacterales bacterium]
MQVAMRNSRLLRELVEAGDKAALSVEGDVLLLEATRGDAGLTQMAADSTRAAELIDGNSPWQTPCLMYHGAATFLEGDSEGARVSLRESASRAAPVITGWLEELRIQLEPAGEVRTSDGDSMLTASELRTLQYLPTHFSFQEIADSLHLSRNTVKSQAAAIYRKLGARTRTEAVRIGVENGLIDHQGPRSAKSPE